MSDVTFAVFRSVEDLLEQMDDQNKVILCNEKYLLIKIITTPMTYEVIVY